MDGGLHRFGAFLEIGGKRQVPLPRGLGQRTRRGKLLARRLAFEEMNARVQNPLPK
jgi:hypothetical protein